MENNQRYVISSLELHLFFARIMKEHSLFLKAGFTQRDVAFIKRAGMFQEKFEHLLAEAVSLANYIVSAKVLSSGEIVTEYTLGAEQQTQRLTGIAIDQRITTQESMLRAGVNPRISGELVRQVRELNRMGINLLNGLIEFKEQILSNVLICHMFTMNYPLLIEHILREAKLYRECLLKFESGRDFECQNLRQAEQFWNQIMMEHALFIRGLLDPTEADLIAASDNFAAEYFVLLESATKANDMAISHNASLQETIKFQQFKTAGTEGIQNCKIRSIILPLLADHVLREANHYIRLLED